MTNSIDTSFVSALERDTMELSNQMNQAGEFGEISASTMLRSPSMELDLLLHPILPRCATVSLIGSSDTGKSSFLRGLAVAIATGASEYVGFELNCKYNRALYVSTEDDQQAIRFLLHKQNKDLELPTAAFEGLDFLFQTENLVENIDKILTRKPCDIVIIDAFADIYDGSLNENNKVRAFLQQYHLLGQKHGCLVLFLHHTGKRTEDFIPSKHNAIGSQGFEAKMRLVAELRSDPRDSHLKHLCIVKGNYLSADFKESSFELEFNENMNFKHTGKRVPFEQLKRIDIEKEEERSTKIDRILELKSEGKTLDEIATIMGYRGKSAISQILKRAGK